MRRKPLLDQAIAERGVKAGLLWLSREAGPDDVEVWGSQSESSHPFRPHVDDHKGIEIRSS
jgi:hypothetical protein